MRILACGVWDTGAGYPRTRSLLSALRHAGFIVDECRVEPPIAGADKRRLLGSPRGWLTALARLRRARRELRQAVRQAVAERSPDLVLVPYPGHLAVSWIRGVYRGPVVLDLFLSAYDTAVGDRRMFRPGSLPARLLKALDRRACAAADLVLLDTPQHSAEVATLLAVDPASIAWVPVSDPDAGAEPAPYRRPAAAPLEVLFFGTGVPLHGLSYLIEAVRCVPQVRLTLVGGTRADRDHAVAVLGDRLRLEPEFVAVAELTRYLADCDLVAGIFGAGGKAQRVVPFKVVHALAAGRPVLTADTPALRGFLRAGVECAVCPAADADSIAAALIALASDQAELRRLAAAARPAYDRCFSTEAVAHRLRELVERVGLSPAPSAGSRPAGAVAGTA